MGAEPPPPGGHMDDARIAVRLEGAGLDRDELATRYEDWLARIAAMHRDARALPNPAPAFTPLAAPLATARVALLTTAGAHLANEEPFDVADPAGDPSVRIIPDDADPAALAFAHSHYDTSRAEEDPNVVLPRDALARLAAAGVIGSCAPRHIGMMGFNPDPRRLVTESAPRLVELLREDAVDVVVLSPG